VTSNIVRIIDGKKPGNYVSLSFMNDLKEFDLMLHTIFNPFNKWWGVEFVRKSDNLRKCVIFNDRMKNRKANFQKVYRAFREVEKFFGVPNSKSKYSKLLKSGDLNDKKS